jgi:two-component system, NtrC family, sensor kinase
MKFNTAPLNLRTKFIISTIIVITLFGLVNILANRRFSFKVLQRELDKRALFLGNTIAQRSTNLLLYEDWISLQNLLDEALVSDADVAYAFVVDNQNNVLVHTFGSNFPVGLLPAFSLKEVKSSSFHFIEDQHQNLYREIAVPLLEGNLGFLRLGISEKPLEATTTKIIVFLTGMVLVFLFFGIVGAIFFSYWITNPISKITRAFETIDLDDELTPLQVKTKDEISVLANKFNETAIRLQNAHSDLKKAQNSLIQTEKLASIGNLASGLTHEISNPLAGLKNCLIRIKKNPNKTQINRYFQLMMNAIEKIEKVVVGLLDFSRKDVYEFKPFPLHKTIDRALSLAEHKFEKSNIRVERNYDRRLNTCVGDRQRIEQVIINLVLNSIDAMPGGGNLWISTSLDGPNVRLEIGDTGEGIASENLDKIFDPFFTTKEPGKGTGLGLSVSYNIVREHGGDISVKSEKGQGTRFAIIFPLILGEMKT